MPLFYVSSFSNPFTCIQTQNCSGLLPLLPAWDNNYHCFLTFFPANSLFLLRFILCVSGKLVFLKHCPDYCHSSFNISSGCLLHSGLNKNLFTRNMKAFCHGLPYLPFAAKSDCSLSTAFVAAKSPSLPSHLEFTVSTFPSSSIPRHQLQNC